MAVESIRISEHDAKRLVAYLQNSIAKCEDSDEDLKLVKWNFELSSMLLEKLHGQDVFGNYVDVSSLEIKEY